MNDQYYFYYTNGALAYEYTNHDYITYVLNNNNTCADKDYETNGTTSTVSGTWSLNSTAKTFTMTYRNITNISIVTDIIASYVRKMYYSIADDNNVKISEIGYVLTYSMYADVRTNFVINVPNMLASSGLSYIGLTKK